MSRRNQKREMFSFTFLRAGSYQKTFLTSFLPGEKARYLTKCSVGVGVFISDFCFFTYLVRSGPLLGVLSRCPLVRGLLLRSRGSVPSFFFETPSDTPRYTYSWGSLEFFFSD